MALCAKSSKVSNYLNLMIYNFSNPHGSNSNHCECVLCVCGSLLRPGGSSGGKPYPSRSLSDLSLSLYLSINQSISIYLYLSAYYIEQNKCLSICLSIYLSIYLYLSAYYIEEIKCERRHTSTIAGH